MGLNLKGFFTAVAGFVAIAAFAGCSSHVDHSTALPIPGADTDKVTSERYFYMTTGLKPGTWKSVGEYDPNEKVQYSKPQAKSEH